MVASAETVRAKYAADPLIRADVVKLFGDGVLEGNPYATPPTLPEALMLHPYRQPIFGRDKAGKATVTGYVDTAPKCARTCAAILSAPPTRRRWRDSPPRIISIPRQCAISYGRLQHDRAVIMEFVRRFHLAGFALHIHVVGDGTLRAALDALEAARAADGESTQHDGLAHVQLADPADVARIGRDRLYVAFTYSWAVAEQDYDMSVIPFIDEVRGNSYAALNAPGGYYESNVYPFKAAKQAGATLVAGSDAPVDSRDPRPFVNMAIGVTRRVPGLGPQNPSQALDIRDLIDAYTINGARFLNRDDVAGSLEVGKSADFIVVDRDILRLADTGRAEGILRTQVLQTWFQGRRVHAARALILDRQPRRSYDMPIPVDRPDEVHGGVCGTQVDPMRDRPASGRCRARGRSRIEHHPPRLRGRVAHRRRSGAARHGVAGGLAAGGGADGLRANDRSRTRVDRARRHRRLRAIQRQYPRGGECRTRRNTQSAMGQDAARRARHG